MSMYTIRGDISQVGVKYFHELKVSENVSLRVKCHPIVYDECNKMFIMHLIFSQTVNT